MASKRNSKQKSQKRKRESLLLSQHRPKLNVTTIPITLSPNILALDLENNQICSLAGIKRYTKLQKLNIRHNAIQNYSDMKEMSLCFNINELKLEGNPICAKVNYLFGIFCLLRRVIQVDGIKLNCGLNMLCQWQKQNGFKIGVFLLQSCLVFDSILKGIIKFDIDELYDQLQNIKAQMTFIHSIQDSHLIEGLNSKIYSNFPLKAIEIPGQIERQLINIKEYYIQKLFSVNSQCENKLVQKILEVIEVVDEQEQKQLQKKTEVTQLILKHKIEVQFQQNQRLAIETKGNDEKLIHFVSAETALQTLDTADRTKRDFIKQGIHFNLDIDYLKKASQVLLNQISRLLHVVEEQNKKYQQDSLSTPIKQNHGQQNSFEQNYEQKISSPAQIYNNHIILSNLLAILQMPLKKIAFRKIRFYRRKQNLNKIFAILTNNLSSSVNKQYQQAFESLLISNKANLTFQKEISNYRLKKLFRAWILIKKRKLKLLKNIVKRKIKSDNFLTAIALTRWKMNSRADRIRRMASAALLSVRVTSMPKSRKGIDLAYKRTIASRARLL